MTTRDFGNLPVAVEDSEYGDRKRKKRKGGKRKKARKKARKHGNKKRRAPRKGGKHLKRPYMRAVRRKGRALSGKHKIGQVRKSKGAFAFVTRGGGVYEGKPKGHGNKRRARGRKGRKK